MGLFSEHRSLYRALAVLYSVLFQTIQYLEELYQALLGAHRALSVNLLSQRFNLRVTLFDFLLCFGQVLLDLGELL